MRFVTIMYENRESSNIRASLKYLYGKIKQHPLAVKIKNKILVKQLSL